MRASGCAAPDQAYRRTSTPRTRTTTLMVLSGLLACRFTGKDLVHPAQTRNRGWEPAGSDRQQCHGAQLLLIGSTDRLD